METEQITFTAQHATTPQAITVSVVKRTATEITGVRLPAELHGHGLKTWMLDEITVAA